MPTQPDRRRLVYLLLLVAGAAVVALGSAALTLHFRPIPAPIVAPADPAMLATERRLDQLAAELTELQGYNDRLRTALGGRSADGVPARDLPEASSQSGRRGAGEDAADFSLDGSPAARERRRRSAQRDLRRALDDTENDPAAAAASSPDDETAAREPAPDRDLARIAARWDARTADAATALDLGFPAPAPVLGVVTRGFDPAAGHYGIDFAARVGRPVEVVADGVVIFADWTAEQGNIIVVQHPGGYLSAYWHNRTLLKRARERVRRGDLIAESGDTGRTSTGPHLHFELWRAGVALDPSRYLLLSGAAANRAG